MYPEIFAGSIQRVICGRFNFIGSTRMSFENVSRRKFMAGAAAMASTALLPSSATGLLLQDPVVNAIDSSGKKSDRERVPWAAQPFPMKHVRLLAGPCKQLEEKNRQYLSSLATDRLVHSFKITAGLPSSADPYGGWERPDSELRGHEPADGAARVADA
jgi:uncharacterized protein